MIITFFSKYSFRVKMCIKMRSKPTLFRRHLYVSSFDSNFKPKTVPFFLDFETLMRVSNKRQHSRLI